MGYFLYKTVLIVQSPLHTDQQLLASLAKGDRVVTNEIYHKNYPIVRGWVIKNGGSETDSADIFQEALMVLFGKVQGGELVLKCSIGTYLFAICKHFWYKKLHKQSKNPAILWDDIGALEDLVHGFDEDVKMHTEREVHYDQLNNALDQIGEPCRSLLKAYYHQDKNMQEIAASFGYTNAENAKNQKYKCLSRLKKLFFNPKNE